MKILITASECAPLVKVGGIADVIGSLPIALKDLGADIKVVLPFYQPLEQYLTENKIDVSHILTTTVKYDSTAYEIQVHETKLPDSDVVVYLIKDQKFISNGGVYFSPETMASPEDELERFAFFSKCIADLFAYPNEIFTPDVIHCNDWHTGMVPQIIQELKQISNNTKVRTVFTIHNLAYQGFSKTDVAEKLGIDLEHNQTVKWDAEDGNLAFILQGIVGADYVTTVSEKYAQEIQTEEFGEGLHDILKSREGRLLGVLNGISYEMFNPQNDKHLTTNFSTTDYKNGKASNKAALQEEIGLEVNPNKPLLGVISRLAYQKGLDLVSESIEKIIGMDYQVVVLGTGDPQLESKFEEYNSNTKINKDYKGLITFSEGMARKIYAASDMFLIPSRYEPSGLTQMIAMKYGSIPVVRATGGLYDTVHNMETGFTYDDFSIPAMLKALENAFNIYSNQPDKWHQLSLNCMNKDFSWTQSAKKYVNLYRKTLDG